MSDKLESAEEGIVYLDPMDIEVDKYNVRHDSPVDKDVIEKIKDDLKSGRGIEYHITVRFKDGKYYCYIGRNRLLAAKEYIKESGKKIMIPAKIRNVDDLTALEMSLNENLKRKKLLPSEISRVLGRIYERWKYVIDMNRGEVGHRDQKIEVYKKYI